MVGHRGLITTYTGDNAERLNSNQLFNIFITNAMRESFEAKVLRHVAQVSKPTVVIWDLVLLASDSCTPWISLQAVEASKMRRGNISAFFKGTGKMPNSNLTAQQDIAATFKHMIDDVERNHATRVGCFFTLTSELNLQRIPSLSRRSSIRRTFK